LNSWRRLLNIALDEAIHCFEQFLDKLLGIQVEGNDVISVNEKLFSHFKINDILKKQIMN
jgi:hypothetical protein